MNQVTSFLQPLVSIIMPAYNAESFIKMSIQSVLNQSYSNWELLIINDGSTDNTNLRIDEFKDLRIKNFTQINKGVSVARNKGLSEMNGQYFCFLDADDFFPKNSIKARIEKFNQNSALSFVDGKVLSKNEDLSSITSVYQPSFKGEPFSELIQLKNTCLLGNTWMIKRLNKKNYQFTVGLSHAEDLSFYLSICEGLQYDFVEEEILWYRRNNKSAMSNLAGLEKGYHHIYKLVKQVPSTTNSDHKYLKNRILRIMFLSWFFDGKNPVQAILSLFRISRL